MSENNPKKMLEEIRNKLSQSTAPLSKRKPLFSSSDAFGRNKAELGIRVWTNSSMGSDGLVKKCRPWDRGDLMKRLATFKAMTWFGKPKAINPVNCARRGWINVEMDVIICEACGTRLLFSTPSSWSLQQVEKAAAVFSLKLDNGHKLLCPWIDNICDEKLAFFPPTSLPALVDSYKERSSGLLRLSALPIISSSAIDYMKCPQLEQILTGFSCLPVNLSNGISLVDNHTSKDLAGTTEDATASIYYQAQKIISLCGWEPCLLPYAVDSDNRPSESSKDAHDHQKECPVICTSEPDIDGVKNNNLALGENQYDPASIVLDCKFCGARVGLWAFETVERPLESFILVAESNGHAEPVNDTYNNDYQNTSKHPSLNLTIAGGPPPTKQSFRPIVSFPIVSRHLSAQLAYSSDVIGTLSLKRKRSDNGVFGNSDVSDSSQNDFGVGDLGAEKTALVEKEVTNKANKAVADLGDASNASDNISSQPEAVNMISDIASCSTDRSIEAVTEGRNSDFNNRENATNGLEITVLPPFNMKEKTNNGPGNIQMQLTHHHKITEFDPIRQHRPFCPWIAPGEGDHLPGWKLTLNALIQQEKASSSSDLLHLDDHSKSFNEVDDPIVSIRKLFMSPPTKKFKGAR